MCSSDLFPSHDRVCPVCGAKNPINAEYCEKCGLQLLKYCPSCHSVNLPNADICRKCSTPFYKAEGEISIADLENQLNESSSVKEEQPVNVGQNADNEIQMQLKQNDLSDVDITKETSNVIEAEKHETDEINTNESDDVDLADIGEEDFELQELQEDELLDFSVWLLKWGLEWVGVAYFISYIGYAVFLSWRLCFSHGLIISLRVLLSWLVGFALISYASFIAWDSVVIRFNDLLLAVLIVLLLFLIMHEDERFYISRYFRVRTVPLLRNFFARFYR